MKNILTLWIVSLFIVCCTVKNEKPIENTSDIGKYVYLDSMNVLHVDKKCFSIHVVQYKGGIEFINIKELNKLSKFDYCNTCITDELYEKLDSVIKLNKL